MIRIPVPTWKDVFGEILRGKSLNRILTNAACRSFELKGRVIDLGARNDRASYYRFFRRSADVEMHYADLNGDDVTVVKVDLGKPLPMASEGYDTVVLMHVLEHLLDTTLCLRESMRILKRGGNLVMAVPFLYRVHPDPHDYFRFTNAGLEKLLQACGFQHVSVHSLGYGPMTAGVSQFARILKIPALVFVAIACAIILDRLLNRLFPKNPNAMASNFPLAYFVVARK